MYGTFRLFGEKGRVLCNVFEGSAHHNQYACRIVEALIV